MTNLDELTDEVIRLRNIVDGGWEKRAKAERQARANAAMEKLQRRIRVSNALNVPLVEVSDLFAEGFLKAGDSEDHDCAL